MSAYKKYTRSFFMRFHCLGVQHTVTNKEYIACAFTQKVLKFCEMMTDRGHTVIHYGNAGADLSCTENVVLLSREEFEYKEHDHRSKLFTYDINGQVYKTFNARAIEEIAKRKKPGDFLLAFWGVGHQPICDAHKDMIVVEPGIGYGDMFAKYKVFESYAIYHAYHNIKRVKECFVLDEEFENEAIIPNYYNTSEFEYCPNEKEDYFLFVGRIGLAKGLGRAIKMAKAVGARLIVAGQNAESGFREEEFWPIPEHVEYVGYIGVEQRKRLMARAKAVVCFSRFVEPFCGVHVEAMMSGTPVITCDWGAMTEFNVHGVTGFRCRTLDEMIEAAKNIHTINPEACRNWAMSNFSVEVIGPKYEHYFERILKKEMTIDYVRIQQEEQPFADRLGPCLKRLLNPKKFLDIGCGPGMHVRVMDSLGISSVGVELDTRASHPLIKNESLLDLHGKYTADLVMSLEVAEHIDEQYADTIVQNMVESIESGGTLIWTSAHPGQGGIGHINCQPKEYWIEKFVNQGLVRDESLENEIKQEMLQGYHMGWFILNLIVFRKRVTKTAIWTDPTWAMGRIATSIAKTMPGGADIYDFRKTAIVPLLERYSHVIAKSDVFYVDVPEHLKKKLTVTFHCPTFTDAYFREHFVYWPDVTYTGVSQETCDELRRHGVPAPIWTPYGADLDIFKNGHVINGPIKRIGITGAYHSHATPEYIEAKGLRLFEELCTRVGAEPVFLYDRKDAEIYKDIDLLVCCSKFEAGPLGIFEAAACGVPVLTRSVGNAQLIDGIALFDTVDDAVLQIQSWNQLPRSLYAYTKHITREVRENWSMQKLLNDTLDFIEIGTSDFNTEIQKAVGTQQRGISVEPIKYYLDALPNLDRVRKVRAAISNFSGTIDVFSLRNPEKYGMPDWVRGCNSIGRYHPQVLKLVKDANLNEQEVFTVEHVPVMTFTELVRGYRSCKYLKIDTEGHDHIVLGSYLDCVDTGKFELVPRILFEANELTASEHIEAILARLKTYGYTVEHRDSCDIIVVRDQ